MSGLKLDWLLNERQILMDDLSKRPGIDVDGGGMAMHGEPAYDIWYTDVHGHGWQLTLTRAPVYDMGDPDGLGTCDQCCYSGCTCPCHGQELARQVRELAP